MKIAKACCLETMIYPGKITNADSIRFADQQQLDFGTKNWEPLLPFGREWNEGV